MSGFNKQRDVTYVNQLNPTKKATIPAKPAADLTEISMKNLDKASSIFGQRKKSKRESQGPLELTGTGFATQRKHSHMINESQQNKAVRSSNQRKYQSPGNPDHLKMDKNMQQEWMAKPPKTVIAGELIDDQKYFPVLNVQIPRENTTTAACSENKSNAFQKQ